MKKDTFDLRKYLVENKMTMNSRKTKKPLGPVTLNESILGLAEGDDSSEEEKYEYFDKSSKLARVPLEQAREENEDENIVVIPVLPSDKWFLGVDDKENITALIVNVPEFSEQLKWDAGETVTDLEGLVNALRNVKSFEEYLNFDASPFTEPLGTGEDSNENLDEAGYTDDEDEDNYERDLDFSAGDSIVSKIGGKNKKARRAAEKEMGSFDEPEDEETSFEDPEDIDDDEVEKGGKEQSFSLQYDPETVDMWMDDEELQEYLNGYRRPQVAAKVLQRALNQAQEEVNDSPGVKKLYLYLKNGFYHTGRFKKPGALIIAQVFPKGKE